MIEDSRIRGWQTTLRSYTLTHDQEDKLLPLMQAYRNLLNSIISDIWNKIEWRKKPINGKEQTRIIPYYEMTREFRAELRNKYLEEWRFAAHWVDSALKTAVSIIDSWRKNYVKGERKRKKPTARRLFLRVKQTLLKLEGDRLRVTIDGEGNYAYIDLSKRYFRLPEDVSSRGIGEPVITPGKIYLPIHCRDGPKPGGRVAWDSNLLSLDGYSPETGWIKIDTKALASVHISSFEKRRSVQRKASKSKEARRVLSKYSRRERNRAKKHRIEIARVISSIAGSSGFEALRKRGMLAESKVWNRAVSRTDWRGIVRRVEEVGCKITEIAPSYSSKTCSRCGWVNRDLRGAVFECIKCGLRIDRQLNAAVNLYLRMEGAPHERSWWDRNVLPTLVGGCLLTGAELKGADELVRSLHDAVKPKPSMRTTGMSTHIYVCLRRAKPQKYMFEMMPQYIREFLEFPRHLIHTAKLYRTLSKQQPAEKEKIPELLEFSDKIIYLEVGGKNPYFMIKEAE